MKENRDTENRELNVICDNVISNVEHVRMWKDRFMYL